MDRLADPGNTINLIKKYGFTFQKRFGQNFLIDAHVLDRIMDEADINGEDHVLEIGPGLGSLTYPLSELTDNMTCVEIDHGLADYLSSNIRNAKIIDSDFTKTDNLGDFEVVVSKMVFMVEEEAIARIDCGPNTKQYGPLAILCSLYGTYKYEFKVPHTAFIPQPRTTSAVISFSREETADILCPEFVKFLNTCFSMRRKMLKKNLAPIASSDAIDEAFRSIGIKENARAEELPPEDFSRLYKAITK